MGPSRRSLWGWLGVWAGAAAAADAVDGGDAAPTRHALAPTGTLRVCINLGNPMLATRPAPGDAVRGVSVDLAEAFAARWALPIVWLVVESAGRSVEAVSAGRADVGFFAIDRRRAAGVEFTAPYLLLEGGYLVRQDAAFTDNAQVDREGVRVVVGKDSAYDLFLTRELHAAKILRAATSPAVVDEFLALGADVAAGVKQQLEADAHRLGGLRLLPGRFMVIEQAMGLPAGRAPAALAALQAFVEAAKASGFVAESMRRQGVVGAAVAPAAPATR